jgi:hypothetical protein
MKIMIRKYDENFLLKASKVDTMKINELKVDKDELKSIDIKLGERIDIN